MVAAGCHELGCTILRKVQALNKEKRDKELAAVAKKVADENVHKLKVQEVHAKGNRPASWDMRDIKVMVSWLTQPGDSMMPQTRDLLHNFNKPRQEMRTIALAFRVEKF